MRSEREFRQVKNKGVSYRHELFSLKLSEYRPRYQQPWQPSTVVGIVVPKKVLKKAVDRNRARRRLREALRCLPNLPACRVVFYPTPAILQVPFVELQEALAKALSSSQAKLRHKPNRPSKSRHNQRNKSHGTKKTNPKKNNPDKDNSGGSHG